MLEDQQSLPHPCNDERYSHLPESGKTYYNPILCFLESTQSCRFTLKSGAGGKRVVFLEIKSWMVIHKLPTPLASPVFCGFLPMNQAGSVAFTILLSSPGVCYIHFVELEVVERLWPFFWHVWIYSQSRKEWVLRRNVLGLDSTAGTHSQETQLVPTGNTWEHVLPCATLQTCCGMGIWLRRCTQVLYAACLLLTPFCCSEYLWISSEKHPLLLKLIFFLSIWFSSSVSCSSA